MRPGQACEAVAGDDYEHGLDDGATTLLGVHDLGHAFYSTPLPESAIDSTVLARTCHVIPHLSTLIPKLVGLSMGKIVVEKSLVNNEEVRD